MKLWMKICQLTNPSKTRNRPGQVNTANETSPVDERSIYGPEASNEAIKKAPEI